MFFISLQKLFSFSRKSNFRILHLQISWRHPLYKHKTRNSFHWITWEINSLLIKFGQFMSYCKIKHLIKKFFRNWGLGTSSRPFCVSKELSTISIRKWNFLKQATYIRKNRHVIGTLSKFIQISIRIIWKLKRVWN